MTPQRFVKRGSGEMVIAKNPLGKQLALPDDLIAKLDATDWRLRKEAVAELGKLAKQANMVPLVRKAVLDRVSIDRDVDVREAMVRLMQQLGLAPPDPFIPEPEPRPATPHPAPPPVQPISIAPQIPLNALDDWQTKVLVKSGVTTSALTGPNAPYLFMELERRANGLRAATYMHRSFVAGVILFGLGGLGQLQEGLDEARGAAFMLLIIVGFGVAGLLNRRTVPAGSSALVDPDMKRLQEAVPLVESWWGWGWGKRQYEAKLFHRTCWWMVLGESFAFLGILTQL